jgi:hypothetical protein
VTLLELVLMGLAFVVGFLVVPILAFSIGRSLPEFIAEPLASALFVVAMLGVGRGKLVQTETGEYEMRRVPEEGVDDHEPRSYWSKWAWAPVAISFEATPEAFDRLRTDETTVEQVRSLIPGDHRRAGWDRERGGESAFVRPQGIGEGTMLIPTGEALSRMRGDGGTALGIESVQEALKKHGGDTAQYSPKVMLGGVVIMALMGMGMGYVVFF